MTWHLEHRSKPMFRYSEYRLFSKFNFSLSCIAEEQVWSSNTGCFEGAQNREGAKCLVRLLSAFHGYQMFDGANPQMFLKNAKVGRKGFMKCSGNTLLALFCRSVVHRLLLEYMNVFNLIAFFSQASKHATNSTSTYVANPFSSLRVAAQPQFPHS